MELRGYKQATAHSHEHTKNSNPSKNNSRQNSNLNLLINSKTPPEIVRIYFGPNSTSHFHKVFPPTPSLPSPAALEFAAPHTSVSCSSVVTRESNVTSPVQGAPSDSVFHSPRCTGQATTSRYRVEHGGAHDACPLDLQIAKLQRTRAHGGVLCNRKTTLPRHK